ncbi:MAG: hypothetical protein KBD83_06150 [Gammaproteobacteria bacterium]|nr:hypothetical protein [Gammaproteobacteria bacterium]
MKKVLLIVSLLASQHLAIAGCSYPMNWTMKITNSTEHDNLSLSCSTVELKPGETFSYTGSSGNECGTSYSTGPTCTYTDTTTQQSGTLTLVFNSCSSVSATTTPPTTNPAPFGCSYANPKTGSNSHAVCDGVDGNYYETHAPTATFIIVNKGPSYQLDWRGIQANLIQGQAMADKLMSHLKAADSYPPTSITTATYNQATSTLTLRVETPTNNPC